MAKQSFRWQALCHHDACPGDAFCKVGADAVVAQIVAAGGKAVTLPADMSHSADVVRLFDTVRADHGSLDVLGYILAIREALKPFGEGGGSINISSILSTDPHLASEDSHWVTGETWRVASGVRGVGY
jgi:hypothetical protein